MVGGPSLRHRTPKRGSDEDNTECLSTPLWSVATMLSHSNQAWKGCNLGVEVTANTAVHPR